MPPHLSDPELLACAYQRICTLDRFNNHYIRDHATAAARPERCGPEVAARLAARREFSLVTEWSETWVRNMDIERRP